MMKAGTRIAERGRLNHASFSLSVGSRTYDGSVDIHGTDDGKTTLPMVMHYLIKRLAEEHDAVRDAEEITFTASITRESPEAAR